MVKNLPEMGRPGFNPYIGKVPGEVNGNPFQYSCLENSMDSGAWKATVHEATESDSTECLAYSHTRHILP